MGFRRVAKRRSGGLGNGWGPRASRPTPRTVLPTSPGGFAGPVRYESMLAGVLEDFFQGLFLPGQRTEVERLIEEGDWAAVLDLFDWGSMEDRLTADVLPVMRATIEREGRAALTELLDGLQVETAMAVRTSGALPQRDGEPDWSKPRPLRTGSAPPVVPPIDGAPPAAPSPRSGGFYATARFDMTNPFAVASAQRFAADLVRQVSRSTRQAIKDTIVEAFREGFTADQVVRTLRETVGLTGAQRRAVRNYRARLTERGLLSEEQVDRATRRYYRKTLKRRAETIARTEIMRASNHGRMEAWRSAADGGLLQLDACAKEWITAPERSSYGPPCPACLPMDGVKVLGAETEFSLPGGRRLLQPPAHPNCRCTVVLWPPEPPEDWDPEYPHAQV